MSKVLTVFGATGNQGGSVIKHILAHETLSKTYTIRAVTRDANKPAAQALKAQGCEVVEADLNDDQSVSNAIEGSAAVFGVTDFWQAMSEEVETAQGKSIANASREHGVEHLIWSSLVNVTKVTNGAITTVRHFDSKAAVEEYIRSLSIPATFFMPGVFGSSLFTFFSKDPASDLYVAAMPYPTSHKFPAIDASSDSGLFVAAALLEGPAGKRIAAAKYQSLDEIAAEYEKGTGRKAVAREVPLEVFKSFLPDFIKEEMAGNARLIGPEFGYYSGEPGDAVEQAQKLVAKYELGDMTPLSDSFRKALSAASA